MAQEAKEILLIGDTFVFNYRQNGQEEAAAVHLKNTSEELTQKVGFEDAFVRSLREEYHEYALADTIVGLLGQSTNPAILHLASVLKKESISCDVVNCSLKHREELVRLLKQRQYRLIGISTTFTLHKKYIVELVDLIKQHAPASRIILGGMFIVKLFKLLKNDELHKELHSLKADYFVFNDIGEQSLIDILKYERKERGEIDTSPNIAYRTEKGYVVNKYEIKDIDTSISDWTLSTDTTYAFLRTSISCLFKCKFCDFPVIGDAYQSKSIEIIRKEMANIKAAGIKFIRFLDDTFNIPKKHFTAILQELAKERHFEWVAYVRCQYLDDQTVRLMKKAGCIGVFLGLESGNDQILRNMNKRATADEYLRGISFLHQHAIPAYGAFIIGFPGETDETVRETIRFIKRANLHYYRLFTWIYVDLAPIAREKEQYSIEVDLAGSNFSSVWKHATMTSQEALEKCSEIMREVDSSIHCTVPFDYAFYLNSNVDTRTPFNECLKRFNRRSLVQC